MNNVSFILGVIALILSALLLPSYVTVVVAVLLIGLWRSYFLVIALGVILDVTFGVPVQSFGGFAYFYTTIFATLVVMSFVFERTLME